MEREAVFIHCLLDSSFNGTAVPVRENRAHKQTRYEHLQG